MSSPADIVSNVTSDDDFGCGDGSILDQPFIRFTIISLYLIVFFVCLIGLFQTSNVERQRSSNMIRNLRQPVRNNCDLPAQINADIYELLPRKLGPRRFACRCVLHTSKHVSHRWNEWKLVLRRGS